MLDRLKPKKIVVASSAPQIRFPDCYGIDMSRMKDFVAYRAVLKLLEERDLEYMLEDDYTQSVTSLATKNPYLTNYVKALYEPFSDEEISQKIAEIIRPKGLNADLSVVFQTVENLHKACPGHLGDWYFTGNYPTQGGNKVVNKAFTNSYEGKLERAY